MNRSQTILKAAARVLLGLAVGAVCGFALLSMSFVLLNLSPSPQTAMIIVASTALAGGAVVGERLRRELAVRRVVAASEPSAEVSSDAIVEKRLENEADELGAAPRRAALVSRWTSVRIRRGAAARQQSELASAAQQPQLGVGAALDAA